MAGLSQSVTQLSAVYQLTFKAYMATTLVHMIGLMMVSAEILAITSIASPLILGYAINTTTTVIGDYCRSWSDFLASAIQKGRAMLAFMMAFGKKPIRLDFENALAPLVEQLNEPKSDLLASMKELLQVYKFSLEAYFAAQAISIIGVMTLSSPLVLISTLATPIIGIYTMNKTFGIVSGYSRRTLSKWSERFNRFNNYCIRLFGGQSSEPAVLEQTQSDFTQATKQLRMITPAAPSAPSIEELKEVPVKVADNKRNAGWSSRIFKRFYPVASQDGEKAVPNHTRTNLIAA